MKHKILLALIFFTLCSFANTYSDEIDFYQLLGLAKEQQLKSYNSQTTGNKSVKALGGTSVINGHVENSSASNLIGHNVTLYELNGNDVSYISSEITDMNGNYSFINLTAGIYLIFAGSQTDDYIDYVWQSDAPLICNFPQRCTQNMSSHINLPSNAILNNHDFTVALGGQLHGLIIDANSLQGVGTLTVHLSNINSSQGSQYLFTSFVNQSTGDFVVKGIPDGNYRVYLQPRFDLDNLYISQVYGGTECNLCIRDVTIQEVGTILNINSANTINAINFFVNIGASINGFVLDNNTLNPIGGNATVRIYGEFNNLLGVKSVTGSNGNPSSDGSYLLGGLLAGSYYVQAGDNGGDFYQRELYNNKPCYYLACKRGSGDAVVIAEQESRLGINFLLEKGGKISGSVVDAATGVPIVANPFELQVQFYNSAQEVVGSAFVMADGSYVSARAIPPGSYAVRTGSMFQGQLSQPYVNQKYNDLECAGIACDLSTADVVVASDNTTTGIDFSLSMGNSFSGTVTDLASSAPVANVHVLVYKDMGAGVVKFANWATTSDGSNGIPVGQFEVTGLPDGTYFARTGYGSDLPFFVSAFHNIGGSAPIGWIDVLYDGLPCLADCDVTTGTPIILPPPPLKILGINTIDFNLNQGGVITGIVTDFINNSGLKEIAINVYNDQGVFMGSSITDNQGNFISRGLPTGTYFLTTSSHDVLLDVKYGNEFCTLGSCNPLDALPVLVTESQQTTNTDFVLKTTYMHLFSNDFE